VLPMPSSWIRGQGTPKEGVGKEERSGGEGREKEERRMKGGEKGEEGSSVPALLFPTSSRDCVS